jgi:excisionase family DNA binding protein
MTTSDDAIAAGDSPKDHGDPLAADVLAEEAPRRVLRARAAYTYGTAEAARLLGLSDRRVRQLLAEGQLPGERDAAGVLHLPQEAVHEERSRRRTPEGPPVGPGRKPTTAATDPEVIAAAVAAAVGQVLAGQRELTVQATSLLKAERERFEAERECRLSFEAEVLKLRARLVGLPIEDEAPLAGGGEALEEASGSSVRAGEGCSLHP